MGRGLGFYVLFCVVVGGTAAGCENLTGLAQQDTPTPTRDGGGIGDAANGDASSDGEGSNDGGVGIDAPIVTGPRCDRRKPYGNLRAITELLEPPYQVGGGIMAADGHELFFYRYKSSYELRHARKANLSAPWTVTTDALDSTVGAPRSLSGDGLKLYFDPSGSSSCVVAARASKNAPFAATAAFGTSGCALYDNAIFIGDDKAYFSGVGGGVGDAIISTSSRDVFGLVAPCSPLSVTHVTGKRDGRPVVNAGETALYFTSDRPGGSTWVSRRASKQESWTAPIHVAELDDATTLSFVTWVSDDECVVLFDRSSQVFIAERPL